MEEIIKEIVIDGAIHNKIIVNGEISNQNLYEILNHKQKFRLFIVSNPGSYTGIRKSLILSIVSQYTYNTEVYTLDVLKYFHRFHEIVGCIVGKHIWISNNHVVKVQPINIEIQEKIGCCNIEVPNQNAEIIDISIEKMWRDRYDMFVYTREIVYPQYVDIFATT